MTTRRFLGISAASLAIVLTALSLVACVGEEKVTGVQDTTMSGSDTISGGDTTVGTDTTVTEDSTLPPNDTGIGEDTTTTDADNPPLDTVGTDTIEELTFEEFRDQAVETICGKLFDCCGEEERGALFGTPNMSFEGCFGFFFAEIPGEDELAALERGSLKLNLPDAQICLDRVAEITCADLGYLLGNVELYEPSCEDVFVGTLSPGAPCNQDAEECAEGSRCSNGTCAELVGEGESCLESPCDDDTYCFWDDPGSEPFCAPRLEPGAQCFGDIDCMDGTYCRFDATGGAGECVEASGEGGLCDKEEHCQDGLRCDFVAGFGECRLDFFVCQGI